MKADLVHESSTTTRDRSDDATLPRWEGRHPEVIGQRALKIASLRVWERAVTEQRGGGVALSRFLTGERLDTALAREELDGVVAFEALGVLDSVAQELSWTHRRVLRIFAAAIVVFGAPGIVATYLQLTRLTAKSLRQTRRVFESLVELNLLGLVPMFRPTGRGKPAVIDPNTGRPVRPKHQQVGNAYYLAGHLRPRSVPGHGLAIETRSFLPQNGQPNTKCSFRTPIPEESFSSPSSVGHDLAISEAASRRSMSAAPTRNISVSAVPAAMTDEVVPVTRQGATRDASGQPKTEREEVRELVADFAAKLGGGS